MEHIFDNLRSLYKAPDINSPDIQAIHTDVETFLKSDWEKVVRPTLSRFIREEYLSEDRIDQGLGIQQVSDFIAWLDEAMRFTL